VRMHRVGADAGRRTGGLAWARGALMRVVEHNQTALSDFASAQRCEVPRALPSGSSGP